MRSPPPPRLGAGVRGLVTDAARLDGVDPGGQDFGDRLGLGVRLRLPSGQCDRGAYRDRRGRSSSVSSKGSTPPHPWSGTCTPASGATPCKRCPTPSTARRIPPRSSGRAGVVAVNTGAGELAFDVSIPPPTEVGTRRHFGTTDVGVFPARVGGRSVLHWNYALTSAWAAAWRMDHVLAPARARAAARTPTVRPVGARRSNPARPSRSPCRQRLTSESAA